MTYVDMYIPSAPTRERGAMAAYIIFCVRLLQVCSFNFTGQSRASSSGTGNKCGSHAFFFKNQSFANEESPAALSNTYDMPR